MVDGNTHQTAVTEDVYVGNFEIPLFFLTRLWLPGMKQEANATNSRASRNSDSNGINDSNADGVASQDPVRAAESAVRRQRSVVRALHLLEEFVDETEMTGTAFVLGHGARVRGAKVVLNFENKASGAGLCDVVVLVFVLNLLLGYAFSMLVLGVHASGTFVETAQLEGMSVLWARDSRVSCCDIPSEGPNPQGGFEIVSTRMRRKILDGTSDGLFWNSCDIRENAEK